MLDKHINQAKEVAWKHVTSVGMDLENAHRRKFQEHEKRIDNDMNLLFHSYPSSFICLEG